MEQFVIEDDIPKPEPRVYDRLEYPFEQMRVGQSFSCGKSKSAMYYALREYRKRGGRGKFTVAVMGDDRVRVWKDSDV